MAADTGASSIETVTKPTVGTVTCSHFSTLGDKHLRANTRNGVVVQSRLSVNRVKLRTSQQHATPQRDQRALRERERRRAVKRVKPVKPVQKCRYCSCALYELALALLPCGPPQVLPRRNTRQSTVRGLRPHTVAAEGLIPSVLPRKNLETKVTTSKSPSHNVQGCYIALIAVFFSSSACVVSS